MTDVDKKALFDAIEKLLRLQAKEYEQRIAAERWRVEMRMREMQNAQETERLRREIVEVLGAIRKQLGLPDLSTFTHSVDDVVKNVEDVFGAFGELFKDFFTPENRSPSS
jgi:hypothetical protein